MLIDRSVDLCGAAPRGYSGNGQEGERRRIRLGHYAQNQFECTLGITLLLVALFNICMYVAVSGQTSCLFRSSGQSISGPHGLSVGARDRLGVFAD